MVSWIKYPKKNPVPSALTGRMVFLGGPSFPESPNTQTRNSNSHIPKPIALGPKP